MYGKGNNGMSGLVLSLRFSIGYMVASVASQAELRYARIQNRQGQYTLPTIPAVQVSGSVGHWVSGSDQAGPVHAAHHLRRAGQWVTGSVGHWVSGSEPAGPVHAAHHLRRAGQWGTGSVGQ